MQPLSYSSQWKKCFPNIERMFLVENTRDKVKIWSNLAWDSHLFLGHFEPFLSFGEFARPTNPKFQFVRKCRCRKKWPEPTEILQKFFLQTQNISQGEYPQKKLFENNVDSRKNLWCFVKSGFCFQIHDKNRNKDFIKGGLGGHRLWFFPPWRLKLWQVAFWGQSTSCVIINYVLSNIWCSII